MALRTARFQRALPALIACAFVLTTIPAFFAIYRDAAFQTTPRDDYSDILLAMMGRLETPPVVIPSLADSAPYGYRLLSVGVAIPFYLTLPVIELTNLDMSDAPYLRATAALAMVSYLSILATVAVVYAIAHRRLGRSVPASILAAAMGFGLFQFVATTGTDPLPILIISLLVYFMSRPLIFAPIVIASAAINEKVLIIFAIVFGLRGVAWFLTERRERYRYWPQTLSTVIAIVVYVGMTRVIQLPAAPAHTDPTHWLSGAQATLEASMSLKGLIQNGIPLAVMAILVFVAFAVWQRHGPIADFAPTDLAVAPILLVIGIIIDAQFTVGRLVMFGFPLYLPLLAYVFDDVIVNRATTDAAPAPT